MIIPDSIRIKGIDFKIEFEDLHNELFGDFTQLPPVIRINTRAGQSEQEITLLHEICHLLRPDMEETCVREFAWDFWQVLKENDLLK